MAILPLRLFFFAKPLVSNNLVFLLPNKQTFAPSLKKAKAVARPIPEPAPVIIATLSVKFTRISSY